MYNVITNKEQDSRMPHLDIATYASQIFWLVAAFTILYIIVAKVFFPSIEKIVDQRTEKVDSDLKTAELLMTEYRENVAKSKVIVDDAKLKSISIAERAALQYSTNFESQIGILEEKLNKDYAKDEEKLFRMKSALEDKMDDIIREVETAVSEKLYNSFR